MTPQAPAIERITTISELAAEAGVSVRRMRRMLRKLHAEHGGAWLFRFGERGYCVNRSLLKSAHPHLFAKKLAMQGDVESLACRVREVEKRQNALAARFREKSADWFKSGTELPLRASEGHAEQLSVGARADDQSDGASLFPPKRH